MVIALQVIAASLPQLTILDRGEGPPWVTIIIVAISAVVLAWVLRASRRAMRRCLFCEGVAVPLSTVYPLMASSILRGLAGYEGTDRRPRNVMVCKGCLTVYDCTPRDYAIVGATRLEREEAIAAGVRLQVGDFGCHSCGDTLAEADSPSLSSSERVLVDAATTRAGCTELRMRLFCAECKAVHLWLPLADTGYRFLRTETTPNSADVGPN